MTSIIELIKQVDRQLRKPHICPKCGCNWDVLWECLNDRECGENRQTACVITANCESCRTEMAKRVAWNE